MFQRPMNINADCWVLDATSTTARTDLGASYGAQVNVIIYNAGSVDVAVCAGDSTVTATFPTSSNDPQQIAVIPPGQMMVFEKNSAQRYLAYITASSTSTVYVKVGTGV